MRWPVGTPLAFSGGQQFVEKYGDYVWAELCDTAQTGQWLPVQWLADQLPSLQRYSARLRVRYLAQVLKAVQKDFIERPEAYQVPPFEQNGKTLIWIRL